MKQLFYTLTFLLMSTYSAVSQQEIKLYTELKIDSSGILGPERLRDPEFLIDIAVPRMTFFPAPKEKSNGTAVLICPGGGYAGVSFKKEGNEFAKWFNDLGVSAFVLYYRMPNGLYTAPLDDAQAALKIIHTRAKEWKIKKKKIGVMGFSAGGHLASTVGTHFKTPEQRPAFMILAYPVITMDSTFTHKGSRNNLLGKKPTDDLVKLYSNELQVSKKTPPTFIVHATDDKTVPIKNSVEMYNALITNKIKAELDTFAVGGHGFGMRKRGIPVDNWPELLKKWLLTNKLINP